MNKILTLIVIGIFLLLTISVGAEFRYYNANRSVTVEVVADDQELLDLKPMQPYAFIHSNGELIIDFTAKNINYNEGLGMGISPDSRYIFDCVFAVSNDLWENKTIVVDLDVSTESQGIVLIYSPSSQYNQGPSNATDSLTVEISPGESACIGFVVDATGKTLGEYTAEITIHGYPKS